MIATRLFSSSIGRKTVVAVTGSLLVLFLLGHMLGNMNMFLGQEAMNQYAANLKGMPVALSVVRLGLVTVLLLHILLTISLNIENRRARPSRYVASSTVRASLASRTMVVSGLILFSFLVYHILHYTGGKMQPDTFHLSDAKGRHDVFRMVVYGFSNPAITAGYVFSMLLVAMHLNHGIQSVMQTLGVTDRQRMRSISRAAVALSVLLFLGFSSVPLSVLAGLIKLPVGG